MASIQINPFVYRCAPAGNTVEHVLRAVYYIMKDASSTHHWKIAEDAAGDELIIGDPASNVLNVGLRALVLEGKGGSVNGKRLLLRRYTAAASTYHHLACSYHPAATFEDVSELETFFGNSSTYDTDKPIIDNYATSTSNSWYAEAVSKSISDPERYLSSSPEVVIGFLTNNYALNGTTLAISSAKMDIVETEDSLTIALYDPYARTAWTNPIPINTAWQRILHVGEIFTPDNRSDPDLKITTREEFTGHGIMAGFYGFFTDTISNWMIPFAPLSSTAVPAYKQAYAEVGQLDPLIKSAWRLIGFDPNYAWGHNTTTPTPPPIPIRPQFGFIGDEGDDKRGERIIPYRIKAFGFNNSLITRFIKQRAFGVGEIDLELSTLLPGNYVNSRFPRSPVSWLHQFLYINSGTRVALNNTVHVWCEDGEMGADFTTVTIP